MDSPPPPTSFISPVPPHPASSEAGMLDQFVIQQAPSPSLKAPLNFGFLYPNPVLRLLKVHAAAHPFLTYVPFFSPYPMPSFHHFFSEIKLRHKWVDIPKEKRKERRSLVEMYLKYSMSVLKYVTQISGTQLKM